jgi:divinyl protochlorophyllide a 8-vinyl-reductase
MSEESGVPAAAVRTMLDAIGDVAGDKGRNMVLRHAGLEEYIENPPPMDVGKVFVPKDHYRAICRSLMDVFSRSSRVLLLYAGEGTIHRIMEALPDIFSATMEFAPGPLRRKAVLKLSAMQRAKAVGREPKVEYEKDKVVYHYYNCPFCEGHESDEPICYYGAGCLKALAEWATGKPHKVTEIECSAMGAEACVYEIVQA